MALVIQSFGKESEYKRAILTIVSYHAWSKPEDTHRTILFTDNPAYFEIWLAGFSIQYVLLTPEKIAFMRGDVDFLHRMKIAIIEEAFHLTGEHLLYADSDTFFLADPHPLMASVSPGHARMHTAEYPFADLLKMNDVFRAFGEMLLQGTFKKTDGSSFRISSDQFSWNAGVMMLHASHKNLLPDVYELTHQFYTAVKHHASEQFAFSVILQNEVALLPCETVIYHYWYRVKKNIMDDLLARELVNSWCDLPVEQKLYHIRKLTTMLPAYFDNHVLLLRDQAIQLFHENLFRQGYGFAFRALLKDPFNLKFCRDLLYHTRRLLFGK